MRYQIHSINDKRLNYKTKIRKELHTWQELGLPSVNGSDHKQLELAMARHSYEIHAPKIQLGQLGIWYSFLDALKHAPIVTFDDDAILTTNFDLNFQARLRQVPDDAHFFSLFLPRDSTQLYSPSMGVSQFVTRTYSRYGGVSFYFPEKGKRKIKSLLKADGIRMQYDDQLYAYSRLGDLKGYCSKPDYHDLVYITGQEESIVQESPVWQRS